MDPHCNPALHNAKLNSTFATTTTSTTTTTLQEPPNYPPPAYEMVVDPTAPIPNMRNPYDPCEDDKDDTDEIPEVTINATTQIRGSGNIISVPPMDAVRIAGLLHTMMYGPPGQQPLSPGMPRPSPPRLNITVNCGATIFGDRNVVGPGLGEVARQMQIARQQLAAQQARGMAASQSHQPVQAVPQPVPILTPIRSRSGSESNESQSDSGRSEGSVAGVKRKVDEEEDEREGLPERKRFASRE